MHFYSFLGDNYSHTTATHKEVGAQLELRWWLVQSDCSRSESIPYDVSLVMCAFKFTPCSCEV